jgi:transcription antitermination factor NusG
MPMEITIPTPTPTIASDDVRFSWCALHTRHQHEKTVTELLSIKGFEILHPTYSVVRKWKDRKKQISLPLFPGYVFLNQGRERRAEILSTPGVCAILGCAGEVAIIPNDEIEAIRRAAESGVRMEPHPYLNVGDAVRVTTGPLAGTRGFLLRKKQGCRLVISIEMLGRSASVEVAESGIESAADSKFVLNDSREQASCQIRLN